MNGLNTNDIILMISLIVSVIMLIITIFSVCWTQKRLKKMDERDEIPKPEIFKITVPKCIKEAPDRIDRHMRFYYGNAQRDLTCQDMIYVDKLSDKERNNLISNKGHVYFTTFNGKQCIMLNFLEDDDYIVVEHQSTLLTFLNSGATLKALSVESLEILYTNGGRKKLIGNPNDYVTFNVGKLEKYELYLDEATNDFNNSICELNTEQYRLYPDGANLLGMEFNNYFLRYRELIFKFIEVDLYDEKYEIEISLKMNMNNKHFMPTTKVIKKVKKISEIKDK